MRIPEMLYHHHRGIYYAECAVISSTTFKPGTNQSERYAGGTAFVKISTLHTHEPRPIGSQMTVSQVRERNLFTIRASRINYGEVKKVRLMDVNDDGIPGYGNVCVLVGETGREARR